MSVYPVMVPIDPELELAVHAVTYHAAAAPASAPAAALDACRQPSINPGPGCGQHCRLVAGGRSTPVNVSAGLPLNTSPQASPSFARSRDLQGELDAVSEKRLWKMQMPEIRLIVPALILSAAKGGANSVIGLLIADATSAFYLPDDDMEKQLLRVVGYFMGCGVALFISNVLGQGILSYSAEALSARLRVQTFRHLMTMEIGFFDEESHSPGALQARLAYDAFAVQAASGKAVSQLLYSFGALVVGLAIALQASWRIGLIILATTPLTVASGYYMIKGFQNSEMDLLEHNH